MADEDLKKDDQVAAEEVVKEEAQTEAPVYTDEEQSAMAKGWKPKDQWEGDEADWKPAKVFNEIGELKDKLTSTEKEVKKLNKITAIMKEHHLNVRQAAYDQAVKDLKAARDAALEDQDFVKAEKVKDQIDDLKNRFSTDTPLPAKLEQEIREQQVEPDPEFFKFVDRNPWYKPGGKDEMSKKADALGWAYANEDRNLAFKDVLTKVEKDIRKLYPEKFDTPRNPVNDGTNRSSTTATSTTKVKLTDEERSVARAFNMSDEEYAKQQATYKGR